jgi:transcriptional antiterminator RfaH
MPLLAQEPFVFPENLFRDAVGSEDGCSCWYVLQTRPRAEKSLARRLWDRRVSFFLPVYRRQWHNRGRLFRSYLPLFPGYVFLHGDSNARTAALTSNLVAGVLAATGQGELWADLSRVYRLIASGMNPCPGGRVAPGASVQITEGPLAGFEGKVLRRDKRFKFLVEVRLLQRSVSVQVEDWLCQARPTVAWLAQGGLRASFSRA